MLDKKIYTVEKIKECKIKNLKNDVNDKKIILIVGKTATGKFKYSEIK